MHIQDNNKELNDSCQNSMERCIKNNGGRKISFMTVGDLKKQLDGLSDSLIVCIPDDENHCGCNNSPTPGWIDRVTDQFLIFG